MVMLHTAADGWKLPTYVDWKRKDVPKNETFLKDMVARVPEKS